MPTIRGMIGTYVLDALIGKVCAYSNISFRQTTFDDECRILGNMIVSDVVHVIDKIMNICYMR